MSTHNGHKIKPFDTLEQKQKEQVLLSLEGTIRRALPPHTSFVLQVDSDLWPMGVTRSFGRDEAIDILQHALDRFDTRQDKPVPEDEPPIEDLNRTV